LHVAQLQAPYRRAGKRVKEGEDSEVRLLVTSNDPVRLSFLTALLADAGIVATVLDAHASAVEGSIGAIPRRLVVATEDEARARRILREAQEI
jgi:Putative prokaryotic signal transducing protein